VQAREIDPDDAYGYATDKKTLQKFVTDTSLVPRLDVVAPPGGGTSSGGG
jgi:twitching motility protein PilT